MRGILFMVFLLIFSLGLSGQNHHIILRSTRFSDSITIGEGDYVKVQLTTGQNISGHIPKIDTSYFLVGYDTIRPYEVYSLKYWPKNREKAGKILIIAGGALIGTGIGLFIAGMNSTNDVLRLILNGVRVTGAGLVIFTVGGIMNLAEKRQKRTFGRFWKLIID